jgi:DNA-binding MarR family transcriptional regulator
MQHLDIHQGTGIGIGQRSRAPNLPKVMFRKLYKRLYYLLMEQTLGTQLRHLIDLLDGAVGAAYVKAGLDYRPRYTPVLRALLVDEPMTIGEIAEATGLTQPAVTQTVTLMAKNGLVRVRPSTDDARKKTVRTSRRGREMLPRLQECWQATAAAARSLDAELPHGLSALLAHAIEALERKPFDQRIAEAHGDSS